jgi:uncharacterized protein (TIGR03067 family)
VWSYLDFSAAVAKAKHNGNVVMDGVLGASWLNAYACVLDYSNDTLYCRDSQAIDRSFIQGTWKATSAIRSGVRQNGDISESWSLKVSKGILELSAGMTKWKCNFKINDLSRPKEIDLKISGSNELDGGRILAGIYECDLKTQTLRLCFSIDSTASTRPTAFASQKGDNLIVIEFKKQN